jgi:hypothetical protein
VSLSPYQDSSSQSILDTLFPAPTPTAVRALSLFHSSSKIENLELIAITDKPKALAIVKWVFIAIIVATTLFAMRYIEKKEAAVQPDIIQQRRKRRQVESQEMVDNGMLPSLHRRNDTSRDTSTVELGLLNAPTPTRSTANVMHSHDTYMAGAARSSA